MNKISYIFASLVLFLAFVLSIELFYMYKNPKHDEALKNSFVTLSSLPDLAICNEAHFIRHRSYSDVFSIFANSPELLEYFPSTFVYNHPTTKNTSRIELE